MHDFNLKYNVPMTINEISFIFTSGMVQGVNGFNFVCYGSNEVSIFNEKSKTAGASAILLGTYIPATGTTLTGTLTVTNQKLFQFVHISVSCPEQVGGTHSYFSTSGAGNGIQVKMLPNDTTPLIANTNFTISTDSTTGNPKITYTDVSAVGILYSESNLMLYETYRRIYPGIRDKNTLVLTDGSNTAALTSTSIIATSLKSATTTVIISNATAPSSGQVLTASSSTSASWQTMTAPTQSYLKFNKILFINTSSYVFQIIRL